MRGIYYPVEKIVFRCLLCGEQNILRGLFSGGGVVDLYCNSISLLFILLFSLINFVLFIV